MVCDVLEHVVDEFAHGKRTAVAKLGQLPTRSSVRFSDLIKLDRVRLAPDLFPVPLTGSEVMDVPNFAATRYS
jgi:hypothetical protein